MSRTITRAEYKRTVADVVAEIKKDFFEWLGANPFGSTGRRGRQINANDADIAFDDAVEAAIADNKPDNYDILSNSSNADEAGSPDSDYIEDIIEQYADAAFKADVAGAGLFDKRYVIDQWVRGVLPSGVVPSGPAASGKSSGRSSGPSTTAQSPRRFTDKDAFTDDDAFDGVSGGLMDLPGFRRRR